MILELGTKKILNKTRANFALKQKQTLLSFLVTMIFRVMCRWGGATTIILKHPTLKATRYMYIALHLDKKYAQMY